MHKSGKDPDKAAWRVRTLSALSRAGLGEVAQQPSLRPRLPAVLLAWLFLLPVHLLTWFSLRHTQDLVSLVLDSSLTTPRVVTHSHQLSHTYTGFCLCCATHLDAFFFQRRSPPAKAKYQECRTLHLAPLWLLRQIILTLLLLPPPLLPRNNFNRHRLPSNTSSCKPIFSTSLSSNNRWLSNLSSSHPPSNMRFSRPCNSMPRLSLFSTPSEPLRSGRAALLTPSLASG
jgi:hypothetical protein